MTLDDNTTDNIQDDNILRNEISTWFEFGDALKNEEGNIFFKMLNECLVYEEGAKSKGSSMSTESLLMALILKQQHMISELLRYHGKPTNHVEQKTLT